MLVQQAVYVAGQLQVSADHWAFLLNVIVLWQVVLTGKSQVDSVSPALVKSEQEAPCTEAPSTGQGDEQLAAGQTADKALADAAAKAAAHPLRVYCEYLSYLFRKPPLPDGQEQLEVGYRDYLQVCWLPGRQSLL